MPAGWLTVSLSFSRRARHCAAACLFVSIAGASASASAQTVAANATAEPVLGEVVVSGARAERASDEVSATVTRTTAEDLEREGATDLKDAFKSEPNVSVRAQPARFTLAGSGTGRDGNAGINVRGFEGNQVLMQVDGVRLPYAFSFGPLVTGRGDYFDIESLKAVEILRGPASSLYGSDGLAGVVSFVTKDPSDYLAGGAGSHLSAKAGWFGVDDSWLATGTVAAGTQDVQGMLTAIARRGHETDNRGDNDAANTTRTKPNPQDFDQQGALAKLVLRPAADQRIKLTGEFFERTVDTEGLSAVAAVPSASTSTLALTANDRTARARAGVEYEWLPEHRFFDALRVSAYAQNAKSRQTAFEDRNTAADRLRVNRYEEDLLGASAVLEAAPRADLKLVAGADLSRSEISNLRDGYTSAAGETFPTKAFPDTDYTLYGLFAQAEWRVGAVTLIPGLRYDAFELDPSTGDALYPGAAPAKLSDGAFSPKLGAIWALAPGWQAVAQYAHGFKAPLPDQVNNGFVNAVQGYQSISNPDLEPETSKGVELGLRHVAGPLRASATVFENRYKNFIEQIIVGGSYGNPADPATFQYVNAASAKIRGAELRADYALDAQWRITGSAGVARGDATQDGATTPLNTIDPWKLSIGAVWQARPDLSASAQLTHAGAKDASRIDAEALGLAAGAAYAPGSWTTLDFSVAWRFASRFELRAGVNNLFDRKYWQWADVRGVAASAATLDAYTSPGRNLFATLKVEL